MLIFAEQQLIKDGSFSSVVVYEGKIYAATRRDNSVLIFEQHGSKWEEKPHINIERRDYTITLSISNEKLFVCGDDGGSIATFTLSGLKTGSNRPEERFHLVAPYLCGTDAQGSAIVAEWGANRIQVMDKEGQGRVLRGIGPRCLLAHRIPV